MDQTATWAPAVLLAVAYLIGAGVMVLALRKLREIVAALGEVAQLRALRLRVIDLEIAVAEMREERDKGSS